MAKYAASIKRYWSSPETNIFNGAVDALLGSIILIVLPFVSLISAVSVDATTWANYAFPIMSICLAGAYDTYGRYQSHSPNNIKLGIRVFLDFLAILTAAFCVGRNGIGYRLAAPIILTVTGLSIIFEVWKRVTTAIKLSPWY